MKDHLTKELVRFIIERKGETIDEAFETLYSSETFKKLSDPSSGLYFQSPDYVYTFLEEEEESYGYRRARRGSF